MEFKVKLKNIELLEENFKKMINPFEIIKEESNVNMKSEIRLGLFSCEEEEKEEEGVALEYNFKIKQTIKTNDREVSELYIKYITIFEDEDNRLVEMIKNEDLNESEFKNVVINMNSIAYPYIKEYIQAKYDKANLTMKLPLEIEVG